MIILSQFTLPAVLLALTLAFGFWFSRLGRPYNGLLFNIHKLTALGAVVLAVLQILPILQGPLQPGLLIQTLLLAAACAVVLFASGALLSAGKLGYNRMRNVHVAAVVALLAALVLVGYWLSRR